MATFMKIECPFSAARLQELYWRDGKSKTEIATIAGVHLVVVNRWLKEFGIAMRSNGDAQKIAYLRGRKPISHGGSKTNYGGKTDESRKRCTDALKRTRRKALIAWKEKHGVSPLTRPCTICGNPCTRFARDFQHPPERTTCSHKCAGMLWKRDCEDAAFRRQIGTV